MTLVDCSHSVIACIPKGFNFILWNYLLTSTISSNQYLLLSYLIHMHYFLKVWITGITIVVHSLLSME